jgi:Na+/proline symporter
VQLTSWLWLFLVVYVGAMIAFGVIASQRIKGADDFAVARRAYGPFVQALAFASTAASGATFLGVPGLSYSHGMSIIWLAFLYPMGIYLGVLICQRSMTGYSMCSGIRR